jgi:hypothetical protein
MSDGTYFNVTFTNEENLHVNQPTRPALTITYDCETIGGWDDLTRAAYAWWRAYAVAPVRSPEPGESPRLIYGTASARVYGVQPEPGHPEPGHCDQGLRPAGETDRLDAAACRRLAEYRERGDLHQRASAAAQALLLSSLTPEQRATWERHNYFEVLGSLGGRYQIRCGHTQGNIYLVTKRGTVASLCAAPLGVSLAAVLLTQKLALETDERGFWGVANVSPCVPHVTREDVPWW